MKHIVTPKGGWIEEEEDLPRSASPLSDAIPDGDIPNTGDEPILQPATEHEANYEDVDEALTTVGPDDDEPLNLLLWESIRNVPGRSGGFPSTSSVGFIVSDN